MRASDVNGDSLYFSIHMVNCPDYPGMTIRRASDQTPSFESYLVPLPDGTKDKAVAPTSPHGRR